MIAFTEMSQDSYRDQWHTQGKLIRASAPALYTVHGREVRLSAGDLLFIRPAELYRAEEFEPGGILQLTFDESYLSDDPGLSSVFARPDAQLLISDKEPELKDRLNLIFLSMQECADAIDPFKETRLKARLLEFLLTYADESMSRSRNRKKGGNTPHRTEIMTKFEAACQYISENCQRELSEEEVAARVGFSPYYFSRSFKKHVGIRYSDYLSDVRVKKAAALLTEGNVPVREAGFMAGFQSVSNYNRTFKAVTGVTPSRFRKAHEKRAI